MFKNVLKSFCWFIYYFVLQVVGMLGITVYDLISGNLNIEHPEDIDYVMNVFTEYLFGIAVPSLIIASVVFFITFIIYKKVRKHPFDYKNLDWKTSAFMICLGFGLNVVLSLIVSVVVMFVPESIANALDSSTSMALEGTSFGLLILGTGIMVPLLEELTFRYGICGTMARNNKIVALVVSSIVFGIMHGNLIQGVYAAILGLIFGVIYLRTNNIWYPAFIHMAINSSSVIASQFIEQELLLYGVFTVVSVIGMWVLLAKYPELKNIFKKEVPIVYSEDNQETI